MRLKDMGHWYSGGTPPKDQEDLWIGEIPWISAKDIDSTQLRPPSVFISKQAAARDSRLVPGGSVLLIVRGMALAHGLPVVVSNRPVAFNQDLRALVPARGIESRFVYYSLIGHRWRLNRYVDQAAHGTARVTDSLYTQRLAVPSVENQRRIADFLDRECARIGELVSRVRQQLEALEEARADVVQRATKDLHLGPLKYGYTVTDCKHRTPDYVEAGYPVISTREVCRGALDLSGVDRFVDAADYVDMRGGGRDPRVGDIVYSRNASVGTAAYISAPVEVCMGQDVVLMSRRPGECELLTYYLNFAVAAQVERMSVGSTFSRINVPVIRSLVVPYDSTDQEQPALATIRHEFNQTKRLEAEMTALVVGLTEYRDALITEAVTGTLDVSAVSDPEMDEALHAAREGERPEVLAS